MMVSILDLALGWLLNFPTELIVVFCAAGLAMALLLIRRLVVDQPLLRRCASDKRRLRELMREAAARGDKAELERARRTRALVVLRQFKLEGPYFALSLVPALLLFTWCSRRVEFRPPAADQPIVLSAYFSPVAARQVIHLLPTDGLRVKNGWIQEVRPVSDKCAMAQWIIEPAGRVEDYHLQLRFNGKTYMHPLSVGHSTYSQPVIEGRDELKRSELQLIPARFLGLKANEPFLSIPLWAWILWTATLGLMFVGKRLCRIA